MKFLHQPILRLGQSRVPQSSLPGVTVVCFRPGLDFSGTGLMYCCMMVFMGVAALNSQANLLFGVFGLMIGVLLISGIISRAVLRRLSVRRELPPHGVVGQPMRVTYEITNGKKHWPSLSVTLIELDGVQGFVAQPQCYLLHAAPGMTARIPVEFTAKRRGLYEFDHYQLATSFPFGFVKRAVPGRQKDLIEIYPALAKVDRRLLGLCRSADTSGAPMRPRPGGADEFYGVKEHRPGDNPRWIYWRRSAHTNKLVSKQMTEVAPPRLLLLVDTSIPEPAKIRPPATAQTLVERTIAMAASLAAAALDDGLSVGLCAYTGPGPRVEGDPADARKKSARRLALAARPPAYRHDAADFGAAGIMSCNVENRDDRSAAHAARLAGGAAGAGPRRDDGDLRDACLDRELVHFRAGGRFHPHRTHAGCERDDSGATFCCSRCRGRRNPGVSDPACQGASLPWG